jgi:hypothetical protein
MHGSHSFLLLLSSTKLNQFNTSLSPFLFTNSWITNLTIYYYSNLPYLRELRREEEIESSHGAWVEEIKKILSYIWGKKKKKIVEMVFKVYAKKKKRCGCFDQKEEYSLTKRD